MLRGITCHETKALQKACLPGMQDDCALRKDSESDMELEIEGFTNVKASVA
jgi:hypothetical protein